MNKLKSENFTMAIGEPFDACFYAVIARLGIDNYISVYAGSGFNSFMNNKFGIPSTPSFLPGDHFLK